MSENRYASNSSPRPPTGAAARPYTPGGSNYEPVPQSANTGGGQYYRPSTQGSMATAHSTMSPFDQERRPSVPTPAYERPNYSRQPSPAPYPAYNESPDDFHRSGYGTEETYPLTAYPTHPGTPGTPYDGFEGETGTSTYTPFLRAQSDNLVSITIIIDPWLIKIQISKMTHTVQT